MITQADQQYLYELYYNQSIETGMNTTEADKQALNASINDATGRSGCDANGPAAVSPFVFVSLVD